jgi:lipopolysaccharide/colanic/teichoic acid biosynthesis glycosyltransferase
LAVLLLSPLLAAVAVAVLVNLGRPVFFRQSRAGRNNEPFEIIKFRTMRQASGEAAGYASDEARLTALGRFLRKSSLDELPELFNVIKGDMSLVGPRPLFVEYYPYYTAREKKRLSIRPGITGLAQISGRNRIGWDRKLELDAEYAENISVRLYLKILIATPFKIFDWRQVAVNPWSAELPLNVERSSPDFNAAQRADRQT